MSICIHDLSEQDVGHSTFHKLSIIYIANGDDWCLWLIVLFAGDGSFKAKTMDWNLRLF